MPCVIEILVADTRGSAPREAGTRMWVGAAETRGTIGGGNLEYTALKIAREMLLSGETQRKRKFALGDALGQCCGGAVTLEFTRKEAMEVEPAPAMHIALFGAGHVKAGKHPAEVAVSVAAQLIALQPSVSAASAPLRSSA